MKNYKRLYLTIFICSFLVINGRSEVGLNKVAQTTMNFLLVSVSPEASAMGEAYYAFGSGAASIFFNPASIVESPHKFDIKLYKTNWIADINYMAGAATWNSGDYGSIGLSILSIDYGTINSTQLLHPSESAAYPLGYKDLGTLDNVSAYAFGLTYAKAISEKFAIGGTIKWVGQNLGQSIMANSVAKDNDASKLVFDAGVKFHTGFKSFRFGMAIRNFATNIKRELVEEQLPLTFTLGAAIDLLDVIDPDHGEQNSLSIAIDFLHPNNFSERLNLGLEYRFLHFIALRGGYQTNQDLASWSAGIGIYTDIANNRVEFNYSYSNFDIFSGVNRFSIGFAF
jgi:hypothetical protein